MSNIDPDLVLHLALDDLRGDRFLDASSRGGGRRSGGFIRGNVTAVPDSLFGACASFSGSADFIEVPNDGDLPASGDATLEAWVFVSVKPADKAQIVGKVSSAYGLWIDPQMLQLNTWYHLAAVFQGRETSTCIHDAQGQLLAQPPRTAWTGQTAMGMDPLMIGAGANGGRLANVRVYKRALSQTEIEQDIRLDLMGLAAFRKSHPIDFRVFDDDEQAVLYIVDDAAGRNVNLELRNTSPQAIQFGTGASAAASETNHHFALRFRPGTLSEGALNLLANPLERAKLLKQADHWDLYFPPKPPAANETVFLYLLYKGPSKTFQPNEARTLTLQRMSAAPGSGARGTQVELAPRQLTMAGGDATPITGMRTQYVHVTNQRGKKNIPLHVGFVGGNTVLNNGDVNSPNTLKLRISYAAKTGEIRLAPTTSAEPSKFILSFDVQPKEQAREWALVTTDVSSKVKVKANDRDITPEGIQGESPEWPITFDAPFSLAPGKPLQIEISGIISSLPSGHANLYVRYEHIPGYWDGQFVCTVEKGPLIYDKGNVGIGTNAPAAKLDVVGDVVADRLSVARANERRGALFFATAGDFNHAIYNNYSNIDGEGVWDGAKWNVLSGLNVRVGAGNARKSALMIDGSGNVGIGATGPQAKLQILHANQDANGNALILGPTDQSNLRLGYHQDYSWVQSHGSKPLAINPLGNNVGIGTTAPITKLQVIGDLLVTGRVYCAGGVAIYNGASAGMSTNGWSLNNTGAGGQQVWGPSRSPAAGGWEWTGVPRSDQRLKKDVRTLPQALEKVLRLRGVSFKWNDAGLERLTQFVESYDAGPGATEAEHQQLRKAKRADACEKLSRPELGLIAQEVREVAPELVSEDEEGYLGVAYERTVALLIEAIKEQQKRIEELSEKVAAMTAK
ncbi:MAG: tail fiber domain-containing protein [Blastocatellia bacterium]